MAIASIRTLLPLDRYAKIMGINPLFFNGGKQIDLSDGRILFPMDNAQNDIWPQYSWQNADQVSREDIAREIRLAEENIRDYLGYYPAPRWTEYERHDLPKYHRPQYQGYPIPYAVDGTERSVKLNNAYFISGGRRSVTLLGSPTVSYVDNDLDGWSETASISLAISSSIDISEVRVYHPGRLGDQKYEIRMPKTKTYTGGNIIITFNSWQMVKPDLYEDLPTNDTDGKFVDMQTTTNFDVTVDLYREYNDTTKNHANFFVKDTVGGYTNQGGIIYNLTNDGFVIPAEADYDSTAGTWSRVYTQCGYSDYVDLWYYSGMKNYDQTIKDSDDYLPNDIATAIAYMATARLEKVFYANNNATSLADDLRDDWLRSETGKFKMSPQDAGSNPFGSRVGEWRAWKMISKYKTSLRGGAVL